MAIPSVLSCARESTPVVTLVNINVGNVVLSSNLVKL